MTKRLQISDFRFQTSNFRLLTSSAVLVLASAALAAQARPQPGTKLPLAQLEEQMFHVSAGRRLKPAAWPNGALLVVVAIYFLTRNHGVLDT